MALVVTTPVPGRAVPLADVPDPVFAGAVVGGGAAVDPPHRVIDVVAPIDGALVKVQPHAFIVQSDTGVAVLVHLGIDTVHLAGASFTLRRTAGEKVRAGDVVTTWDVAAAVARGLSPMVPVIALDQPVTAVHPAPAVTTKAELTIGDVLATVG
ncbi:MAG: sugar system component [Actinomycetota bacterium]|nr:sugar system component [Actinomycetota bacterium]